LSIGWMTRMVERVTFLPLMGSLLISPPQPPQPNFRLSVGLSDLGMCGAKMLGSEEQSNVVATSSSLPLQSRGQLKIGNPTSSFVSPMQQNVGDVERCSRKAMDPRAISSIDLRTSEKEVGEKNNPIGDKARKNHALKAFKVCSDRFSMVLGEDIRMDRVEALSNRALVGRFEYITSPRVEVIK